MAQKTILICDDDQGMRDTIAAILKRDYRVLTVSSGWLLYRDAQCLLESFAARGGSISTRPMPPARRSAVLR